MASLKSFCEWMRIACAVWSVGYDQLNRYDIRDGGESDCSSLVIWALNKAGFDTGTAGYTGNLSDNLTKRGWIRIPFRSLSQIKTGDILLNDELHVCAVIEGEGETALVAQASIDERGRATGGQAGDQTGNETNIKRAYVYSKGWDCILRYSKIESSNPMLLDLDGSVGVVTVKAWQKALKTPVDGVISGQAYDLKSYFPAFYSVTWDGTGSMLIKRVQEIVGVPNPLGIAGPHTVALLQAWLIARGYLSCCEDTVATFGTGTAKALQESLNDGRWT